MDTDQLTTGPAASPERAGNRRGTAALFVVAALAFLLPFGAVSCDGEHVAFTGLQLATSTVPPDPAETERGDGLADDVEDASPIALTALVLLGFGIGSALVRRRGGGFALAASLTLLVLLLNGAVSLAEVQIEAGFWLALLATLGAGALRLVAWWTTRGTRPRRAFWRRLVPSPTTGLLAGSAVVAVALVVSVMGATT